MQNTRSQAIPFHRAAIGEDEITEVISSLRSGWLTTGPRTKQFEADFAKYVGSKHAVALNSATAALHLALEAVGLTRGDAVLVPTMTFAATAEVVRYFDAEPILVDCYETDLNINVEDARSRAKMAIARGAKIKAIIPVHYGGQIADIRGVRGLADEFDLKVIEDAAHCCPAFYRDSESAPWRSIGSESDVACYSFYANKCITTGEGGMACTNDDRIAERIRIMSLHGISKDAWKRFTAQGSWQYEIVAPGYKYNLTDIASAIGIHQLRKADEFRTARERIAAKYSELLEGTSGIILPQCSVDRIHSWHLYVVRLRLEMLTVDRATIMEQLKQAGIGASVHWIPLHMHPYYRQRYGYRLGDYPIASAVAMETISLPIFPGLNDEEIEFTARSLSELVMSQRR